MTRMDYDKLMSLVIQYGGAKFSLGLSIGDEKPERKAKHDAEANGLLNQIQAELYRLHRERGDDV
jgi:hypothetical protein